MKMLSKKRIAAVALTVAALSLGSIGIASADHKGAVKTSVLAELVKAGTITQAQSDAINQKFGEAKKAVSANRAAKEALVATTIGLDPATIKTRLAAGETLGAIAGAKKDALIAALVDFKTKKIDAAVAAGKLTTAQATTMKAGLTDRVTKRVNTVGGKGMGQKVAKALKGPKAPRP